MLWEDHDNRHFCTKLHYKYSLIKDPIYKSQAKHRMCKEKQMFIYVSIDLGPSTLLSTREDCSKLAEMESGLSLLTSIVANNMFFFFSQGK